MIEMYHNPRCSKSRQALALLQEQGIEPKIILYLDTPPTEPQLTQVLKKLGITPRQLLRTGESSYKELGLKSDKFDDTAIIKAMCQHPKLIERPIAIKGAKAVIGRPPENVLELV